MNRKKLRKAEFDTDTAGMFLTLLGRGSAVPVAFVWEISLLLDEISGSQYSRLRGLALLSYF